MLSEFRRFEYKYWVTEGIARRAVELASPYLQADIHGGTAAQLNSSLYLESPDLHCYYGHVHGWLDRFKLRVRTYGEWNVDGKDAFFEIKRKVDQVIHKSRARIPGSFVRPLLAGTWAELPSLPDKDAGHLSQFLFLQHTHRLAPMIFVQSVREAHRSLEPIEDVRLTIDREIVCQPARQDLAVDPKAWMSIDTTREHGEVGRRVMLELKFRNAAPPWMRELVERLGMERVAYSKYCAAVRRNTDPEGGDRLWLAAASH